MCSPIEQFEFFQITLGIESTLHIALVSSFLPLYLCTFAPKVRSTAMLTTNTELWLLRWLELIRSNGLLIRDLKYTTYIMFLPLYIFMLNILGLIPFSFTVTSHISFTLSLAAAIFINFNITSVRLFGSKVAALFLPSTAPNSIAFLLVLIEGLSYMARVLSLSIRLFANMMASHILLKILMGFVAVNTTFGKIPDAIVYILILVLLIIDFGIAALQAYIFTILCILYLKDALYANSH